MEKLMILLAAFILDLFLADPYHWPHPVKAMGAYIQYYQRFFKVHQQSEARKKYLGLGLVVSLLAITGFTGAGLLYLSRLIHPLLYYAVSVYFSYSCLSMQGMAREARGILKAADQAGLDAARNQLSRIVGRQTDELSIEEIYAATIESTSENTSDGVIAPLFYLALFGPVGGLLYKAVNTMDSMVAYLTPRYKSFGFFAAKLDDLVNYVPARLTALFMLAAGKLLSLDIRQGLSIYRRDSRKHLSPNAGCSEAVTAGLLGIQLGGSHTYQGQVIVKPSLGDEKERIQAEHVQLSIALLYTASLLFLLFSLLVKYMLEIL